MRGVLVPILVVGLIIAFTRVPTASADTRPRVAVLGLEVTSAVDVRTTELAHDMTEGMRARARLGAGPYAYAPSSERELIDEKLIKACDNEAPACMSDIGKELDADVIVYGKLEKEDKSVRLTLHLLDVGKKAKLNRISVVVPLDASKDDVKTAARKAYEELAGASAAGGVGTVEIEANVPAGTVYVDDSSSETLANGKATLTLPEGRYRVAVESAGKQRKEITVTVKAEQVITQQFDLVAATPVVPRKKGFDIWKPAFGVSVAAFLGFFSYTVYLHSSWTADVDAIRASKTMPGNIDESDCDGPSVKANVDDKNGVLTSVCETLDKQKTMMILTGVTIPLVALTTYFVFFRKDKSETPRTALTPMITPTTAGASFQVRF